MSTASFKVLHHPMWLRALAMLLLLQATANTQKLQSPAIGGQPHMGITLSMNSDAIAFK